MKLIKCPRCESNIFGKVYYCPCCSFLINKSLIKHKYDIEIEEKYCHICGCRNIVYLCKRTSAQEKLLSKLIWVVFIPLIFLCYIFPFLLFLVFIIFGVMTFCSMHNKINNSIVVVNCKNCGSKIV